jgi:hypothetical protein
MSHFVLLLLMNFAAPKCDCSHLYTFEDSKYVFRGVVASIDRIEEPYIRYDITFKVVKWKKGKRKTKIMKVSESCLVDGCCGISFELNQHYDVYTFMRNNLNYTSSCTPTEKVSSK